MGFEPTTSTLAKSVRSRHKRTNLDLFAGRAGPRGYRRERAGTRENSTLEASGLAFWFPFCYHLSR